MKIMLLLVGAPASGKSTWIKENKLSDYVVSYDTYREMAPLIVNKIDGVERRVIDNSYKNTKRAIAFAHSDILKRASKGELIIVDNQNVRRKYRRDLMKLVENFGYKTFAVNIQGSLSLEELLRRNNERPEHKYVPIDVIERSYETFIQNLEEMKKDEEILYLDSNGGVELANIAKENRAILDPFLEDIEADMVKNMKIRDALLSEKPSKALREIKGIIDNYLPELNKLKYVNQNPKWHPEGNVWNHTMQVIDAAAKIKEDIEDNHQLDFMYAALLHDFGKYTASYVTPKGDISARYHDTIGEAYAEKLLKRIATPDLNSLYIVELVGNHMRGHSILEIRDATLKRWVENGGIKLAKHIVYLNAADNNREDKFAKDVLYIKAGTKKKLNRVMSVK